MDVSRRKIYIFSKAKADDYWNTFESKFNACQTNADMLNFCKKVELTTGVLYGLIKGIDE